MTDIQVFKVCLKRNRQINHFYLHTLLISGFSSFCSELTLPGICTRLYNQGGSPGVRGARGLPRKGPSLFAPQT